MTANTHSSRNSISKAPLIILALLVLLIALPPLCRHAVDKHGTGAISARVHISNYDPDKDPNRDRRWFDKHCPDGRRYRILELPPRPDKPTAWAVFVTGSNDTWNATSYITNNKNWVEAKKTWCTTNLGN